MQLEQITNHLLQQAVLANDGEFDTHDIIFWLMRSHPREYVQDLNRGLQDRGDPFNALHTAIGRQLATLTDLVEQLGKHLSQNIRGERTPCERWRRLAVQRE